MYGRKGDGSREKKRDGEGRTQEEGEEKRRGQMPVFQFAGPMRKTLMQKPARLASHGVDRTGS